LQGFYWMYRTVYWAWADVNWSWYRFYFTIDYLGNNEVTHSCTI